MIIKAKIKLKFQYTSVGNKLYIKVKFKLLNKIIPITITEEYASSYRFARKDLTYDDFVHYCLKFTSDSNKIKEKGKEMILDYFKEKENNQNTNIEHNKLISKIKDINKQDIIIEVEIKE